MEVKRQKLGIRIEVPDTDELSKNYLTMAVVSILLLGGIMFFLIMEMLGNDIFI